MNATGEAAAEIGAGETELDIEALFCAQYERMTRVIARLVRDRARAEELAVEVFLKLWRNKRAQGEKVEGWLYRAAVRTGLDELRRRTRRSRVERLLGFVRSSTPEDIWAAGEERERVRLVLSAIGRREAEMLALRSDGLSYDELAAALDLNPSSVGTLLSRAQRAFRKEYIKRYGEE